MSDPDISLVSKTVGISRTVLYQPDRKLQDRWEQLHQQILQVLSVNPSYGHRRIALALGVGKKRIRKVLKLYGIKPYKRKARWTKRRDLGRPEAKYANLIKGTCPVGPGIVLVSDFTRIPYIGGAVYLATFMDLYTREIVGWNVSTRHTQDLVINAFFDAVKTLGKIPKVVHSNQGSEYQSKEYITLMDKLGIQISMSKKGSPWENGYQESWYDNFKTDLGLEFDRFNSLGELIEAIHQTIVYYNQTRIHTTLKMSPVQFKHIYNQRFA
jgi:transposase InsO family protein